MPLRLDLTSVALTSFGVIMPNMVGFQLMDTFAHCILLGYPIFRSAVDCFYREYVLLHSLELLPSRVLVRLLQCVQVGDWKSC